MPKAKRKPPSRERYEKSHPTVSARVSLELYKKLNEIREKTGKSFADILKEGLDMQEPTAYDKGYKAGHKKGIELGMRLGKRVLLGNCTRCGKPITWDLSTEEDKQTLSDAINGKISHIDCGES